MKPRRCWSLLLPRWLFIDASVAHASADASAHAAARDPKHSRAGTMREGLFFHARLGPVGYLAMRRRPKNPFAADTADRKRHLIPSRRGSEKLRHGSLCHASMRPRRAMAAAAAAGAWHLMWFFFSAPTVLSLSLPLSLPFGLGMTSARPCFRGGRGEGLPAKKTPCGRALGSNFGVENPLRNRESSMSAKGLQGAAGMVF